MFRPRIFPAALLVVAPLSVAVVAGCSRNSEPAVQPAAETLQAGGGAPATSTTPGAAAAENEDAPALLASSAHADLDPAVESPPVQQAAPPAHQPTRQDEEPVEIIPAELRAYYPPFYPLPLRMEGVEGRIDLRVEVNASGEVTEVSVITATAPQFREYAVEAARRWKFAPARRNGEPVPVTVTVPVPFISEFGTGGLPPNSPLAGLTYFDGMYFTTDANGRYVPANQELKPLARHQPTFRMPEGNTEPVRATLMFTVTEEGKVIDPKVVETTNEAFGEAALEAVRFWQFVPRIRSGRPQSSQVQVPIVLGSGDTTG